MKKILGIMAAVLCMHAAVFAVEIETALAQTAEQFSKTLKAGSTIAIVGISSDTEAMSDFMLDELTVNFVKQRKLKVADRANLAAIKKEMNFQLSGEVGDDSIQQIGAMAGAQTVIRGNMKPLGDTYLLVIHALNVTTAAVEDIYREKIEPNETTALLLGSKAEFNRMKTHIKKSKAKKQAEVRAKEGFALSVGGLLGYSHFAAKSEIHYKGYNPYSTTPIDKSFDISAGENVFSFDGFLDVKYAALQVGISGSMGSINQKGSKSAKDTVAIKNTYLNIGVLGKFPFKIKTIKLFPLLGFDTDIALNVKFDDREYDKKDDFNRFWLDVGLGADIPITGGLFLRPQALFGFSPSGAPKIYTQSDAKKHSEIKFNIAAGLGWKF